jgi:protein-disulfide isomerase
MDKRFLAVIGVIIVLFGGIIIVNNNKKSSTTSSSSAKPTNHIEGNPASKVTLVEYGDYECPYCGQYYPIVKQVVADNTAKIQFQFRNLPLSQVHKNAFASARAAEAASVQGKFWQMHDLLYAEQDPNGQAGWVAAADPLTSYFVGYARQLGLNVNQFKTDFASSSVNDAINADMTAFGKTGLAESTPTFFINGKQIHPGYQASDFQTAIDTALKSS